MNDFSEFEQITNSPKPSKKGEKFKWIAIGLLLFTLAQGLFTARFWRLQREQALVITQLQTTLERSQAEMLDLLDEQVTMQRQIAAFEDEFGSMEQVLLRSKIELAIKNLGGDMTIFPHPEVETLYFFTDVSAAQPSIWSYDVRDDQAYTETGEINVAGTRKAILDRTSGSPIEFIQMDRNRIVFLQDPASVQGDPCYSMWLSSNIFAVEITGSAKEKERYRTSSETLEQERLRVLACEEGDGV